MTTAGGGRFDFDDGGTYCGGWEEGKAHGTGVCTGPKGQGEFAGAWQFGFEISGVFKWPSGNNYQGQWFQGKRHGLGVEAKGRWVYRGEWTQGFKGRYGVRQSTSSGARYEGTWATGLQDGHGCETYADEGTYQGQWYRGTRHGYGVRQSVPYGLASHYRPNKDVGASLASLRSENDDDLVQKSRDRKLDESRGGFVLKARSDETPPQRRRSIFNKTGKGSLRRTLFSGLKLKKQKSTGDIIDSPQRQLGGSVRSTISNLSQVSVDSAHSALTSTSNYTDSNLSFVSQDDITDVAVTETYLGEWKNDKRSGMGISERSDGLKYEGEWYNNRKYGYGVTTFKDGSKEEGKYKNNVLISSGNKSRLFLVRSSKLRERVDSAALSAQRAAQIALQKADIAITRMSKARDRADQADRAAERATEDSELARQNALRFDPDFLQPVTDMQQQNITANDVNYDPSHHMTGLTPNHAPPSFAPFSPTSLGGPPAPGLPPPNHYSQPGRGGNSPGFPQDTMFQTNMAPTTQAVQERTPSVKIRRYSFLAGSRHSRGLNDVFNSTVLTDHFDQYSTEDGGGMGLPASSTPTPTTSTTSSSPQHPPQDSQQEQEQLFLRRRTIPCIASPEPNGSGTEVKDGSGKSALKKETSTLTSAQPRSTDLLSRAVGVNADSYIIENGIRKRVTAEIHQKQKRQQQQQQQQRSAAAAAPPQGQRLGRREFLEARAARGSLPDLKGIGEAVQPMSRAEAFRLGQERRQELQRLHHLAERRQQGDVGVLLGDVKDWCQERQLLMLVIAINVSLATMFFHILS